MSEVVEVNEKTVRCDGESLCEEKSSSSQGHPAVYLKINQDLRAECPYCGRIFIYKNLSSFFIATN